jgi:hypothetical protein
MGDASREEAVAYVKDIVPDSYRNSVEKGGFGRSGSRLQDRQVEADRQREGYDIVGRIVSETNAASDIEKNTAAKDRRRPNDKDTLRLVRVVDGGAVDFNVIDEGRLKLEAQRGFRACR